MTHSHDRAAELASLPLMPRDEDGPVFREPWQAQAFAVVVELIEAGRITRVEWAEQLGVALKAAEERGEYDTADRYYDHWLVALEALVKDKEFADSVELDEEKAEIKANDHHRRSEQLGHDH